MVTRNDFLIAYREEMRNMYTLSAKQDWLDRFMEIVAATIDGNSIDWVVSGTAAANVWKALGMKGDVTLEALRELPI